MDQDKRSTQAIDPALLDRARKLWPYCMGDPSKKHGWPQCLKDKGGNDCDLHAAIARALEEYGDMEYRRGERETVESYYSNEKRETEARSRWERDRLENSHEEDDITW